MHQVSCWGSTDTRPNRTKFSDHDDPSLGIGAPLWSMVMFMMMVVMVMIMIVVSGGCGSYSVRFQKTMTGSPNGQCQTQLPCSIRKQLLLLSLPILTGLWTKERDVTWSKIYPSSLQLYRQHVWGRIFSSLLDDACSSISAYYPSQ